MTTLFILCVASLALFTLYVREGDCSAGRSCGPLHTVQLGAAEVLRPVRAVAGTVASPVGNAEDRLENALSDEEADLRKELREKEELAAQASRLERENARLRELLKGQRSVYEYGPLARVVAPVGDQLTSRIIVDVGSEDGVEANRPVVIGKSTLIGRTTQVSRNTSEVMLVSDPSFKAGVRIVPPAQFDPDSGELSPAVTAEGTSYGQGLLSWDLDGYLGVDLVDRASRAEKGDYVVTSGRAGERELLFPPGLLVGTVEQASSQDVDQYKYIVVDDALNPDDLEEVRVIVGW